MASGWIKLHRKIWDSEIWTLDEPFDSRSAWIDLLLLANHEDGQVIIGKVVMNVKRGQHLTSISKLAIRWNRSRPWVRRYLNMLKDCGMIRLFVTASVTTIELCNFNVYQDFLGGSRTGNVPTYVTGNVPGSIPTSVTQTINIKKDIRSKEEKIDAARLPKGGKKWET